MKRLSLNIDERVCIACGGNTRNPLYCAKCYDRTPAGRADKCRATMLSRYRRVADGGPCRHCVHWEHRCLLGVPEAGTLHAEGCAAREVEGVLE